MRTIKFRGKIKNGGEWIYGHYSIGGFIHSDGTETERHLIHGEVLYDVNPDTVGQFTGLFDKNGKEIYEGDIVIRHGRGVAKDRQGVVLFQSGQFVVSLLCPLYYDIADIEVIGNVYDNKDLLWRY